MSQVHFDGIIVAGAENAVTEYLEKPILGAKMKYFFGKIMLPECTCGKLILPFRHQFINFSNWVRVKSGKLMLPGVAILWVKLQHFR
jgi:hypothetical protein